MSDTVRFCSHAVPHVVPICDALPTGFFPEDKGPYALTPNTADLIPTLGALFPRGGPVQDPVLAFVSPSLAQQSTTPTPSTAPKYPCDGSLSHLHLYVSWDIRQSRPDSGLGFQAAMCILPSSKNSSSSFSSSFVLRSRLEKSDAGVPCSQETAPPWDPTVGICLGP